MLSDFPRGGPWPHAPPKYATVSNIHCPTCLREPEVTVLNVKKKRTMCSPSNKKVWLFGYIIALVYMAKHYVLLNTVFPITFRLPFPNLNLPKRVIFNVYKHYSSFMRKRL